MALSLCPPLLAILCLSAPCLAQYFVMVAPNILRVENEENVFVEVHNAVCNFQVTISVLNFPESNRVLLDKSASIQGCSGFVKIKLNRGDVPGDPKKNIYVNLRAVFNPSTNPQTVESVVLVSFQAGYVYIQTDKPIYNPEENVNYRLLVTNTDAKSVTDIVTLDIKGPDGIVVRQEPGLQVEGGIFSRVYSLPEFLKEGTWSLEARLQNQPDRLFSTQFDVKKHVLPTFETTITPKPNFFHKDDKQLTVDIKARYLFGKDVEGSAYVIFGHLGKDDAKTSFQKSLQRIDLKMGKAQAILKREDIDKDINSMLGDFIYIRVTVFTITGSEIVESENKVKVVSSPYKILFTKSSKYFKPGMPHKFYVQVVETDGSPAQSVPMIFERQEGQTNAQGVALFSVNTNQNENGKTVTVKTNAAIPDNHQASIVVNLEAYKPTLFGQYLYLSVSNSLVSVGDTLTVTITLNEQQSTNLRDISYMLVSRGKIVKFGRWAVGGSKTLTQQLLITSDLLPSFRVVAYYILSGTNVLESDSAWVDVEDTCEGTLKVYIDDQPNEYLPADEVTLTVKGDPGAKVGLVVVDKAAYALSQKGNLTQTKVWDAVEERDIGCTKGGGKDNMGVFIDAGLLFQSNQGLRTVSRQSHVCPSQMRKRRFTPLVDAKREIENRYHEDLQKKCCRDGMTEHPLDYSCEKRALYITDQNVCKEVFLKCCREVVNIRKRFSVKDLILSRNSESSFRESDIYVRSNFDVSWHWVTDSLPNKPGDDGLVTNVTKIVLKDSITTWKVIAVSASASKGVCVAVPLEIMVNKRFFVDLLLPYSVVNKEQVEIKAVLHNYNKQRIEFVVELEKHEHICSLASRTGRFRQNVIVNAMSTSNALFTIVPLMEGKHYITVRAFNREKEMGDAVRKPLLVVPEGIEEEITKVVILNPAARTGGRQSEEYVSPALTNIVPGTEYNTQISVLGDEIADTVEKSLSGNVLGSLIRMPGGCVEQNVASMTLPVIAVRYLDSAQAWESVGVQRRAEAIGFIHTGYQNQLQFRKQDDSYPPYQAEKTSTWVTAYVARVYAMASPYGRVVDDRICNPVKYLFQNRQAPDGSFEEEAPVTHSNLEGGTMNAGKQGLTAFVVIAVVQAKDICENRVSKYKANLELSVTYLRNQLPALTIPYAVALISYALAFDGTTSPDFILSHLRRARSSDGTNWGNIEATGYGMLALLKLDQMQEADRVIDWLMGQVNGYGAFQSTQSTVVAFQAVAEYKMKKPKKDMRLDIKLKIKGRTSAIPWTITKDSWSVARSSKVKKLEKFDLEASGSGSGKLVVYTKYHAIKPRDLEKKCLGFEMDVQIKKISRDELQKKYGTAPPEGVKDVYTLTICLKRRPSTPETMTVLDVSVPTGFLPSFKDLEEYKNRVDSMINYFNMDTELSRRGSLMIHLYKIPDESQHCVPVVLYQEFQVGLLQPSSVTVYSYYDKDRNCTKFYHPTGNSTELGTLCKDDVCQCVEQSCPDTRKGDETVDRSTRSCATTTHVYEMIVTGVQYEYLQDKYIMRISKIYKYGKEEKIAEGDEREFYSHISCRGKLGLQKDQTVLLIGHPNDVLEDKQKKYAYLLSSDTWLERVPTPAECQGSLKNTCAAIAEFKKEREEYDCPN